MQPVWQCDILLFRFRADKPGDVRSNRRGFIKHLAAGEADGCLLAEPYRGLDTSVRLESKDFCKDQQQRGKGNNVRSQWMEI